VRRYGDFSAAEDAVQEALVTAALRWSRDGLPDDPRAWLVQTASRRMIDQWRSDRSRRERESMAALEPATRVADEDDTLILLFMCCHPALSPSSAIPLTLRGVGGLTTAEIAKAFLVGEATMAQRISRAKQRIRDSGVPFRMPDADEQPERVRMVLRVLYLIFNEGYATSGGGELRRADLTDEAIRLARMAHRMLPDDAEAASLLALMLLVDARSPARTDASGELVPLGEQDRTLWDAAKIGEGKTLLEGAMGKPPPGEYRLQAAIAAVHDRAASAEETDWPQILALYGLLEEMTGNPLVTLSKAVAAAMADGPAAGLAVLDEVDERLAGHYRLHAVRAHLLEMSGDETGAIEHYRAAADRATNLRERHYLALKAARLNVTASP
jgi:predicted RNA polymerase sigma factor